MLLVIMSLTRATELSSHPIHRILSNDLSPSLALESENNVSMQNNEFLACAEGRKSHSCPDPSLITALLEMASVLDYEEDSETNPLSHSPSTPKSPLAQNQNNEMSDGCGSVHDPSSSAKQVLNQSVSATSRSPPKASLVDPSLSLQISQKSARCEPNPAMHKAPPLGEQMHSRSQCGYPFAIPPLSKDQQFRALHELARSTSNETEKYPSRWGVFMTVFGRWMTSRPLRSGLRRDEFEFMINGFDAAMGWILTVHLDWEKDPTNKPNNRRRIGDKWMWRQRGWLRFILPFQDREHYHAVPAYRRRKIPIKWRLVNGCAVTYEWVIMIKGYSFDFCISKSVPDSFSVNMAFENQSWTAGGGQQAQVMQQRYFDWVRHYTKKCTGIATLCKSKCIQIR